MVPRALVLALLVTSCADTTVSVRLVSHDCQELAALDEAVEILGGLFHVDGCEAPPLFTPLDGVVFSRDEELTHKLPWSYGEARVWMVESVQDTDGVSYLGAAIRRQCRNIVGVTRPDPLVIAHELAHVLTLSHEDVAGNLMAPSLDDAGEDLEPWQWERMAASAEALARCL